MSKPSSGPATARPNLGLLIGGIFGFLSITFAAFADHALKTHISEDDYAIVMKAIDYQRLHAGILIVLGLSSYAELRPKMRWWIGVAELSYGSGVLLFSGGIYVHVIGGVGPALAVVPAGGVAFMLGWLALAVAGLRAGAGAEAESQQD